MPNKKQGTKISEGRRRKGAINDYLGRRQPIPDSNSDHEFVPQEDEIFVPAYHFIKPQNSNRNEKLGAQSKMYIVSNKGTVITFETPDRPKVMKRTLVNPERGAESYIRVNDWYLHRAVWFSFAADAIVKNTDFPPFYGIDESLLTLDNLVRLAKTDVEINHIDLNRQNNCLDNLECDQEGFHDWIHSLRGQTEEERFKTIVEDKRITEPTVIEAGERVSIRKLNQAKFEEANHEQLDDVRWAYCINRALVMVTTKTGLEYFSELRYGLIIVDDKMKSIRAVKEQDEIVFEDAEFMNEEYDFTYEKKWENEIVTLPKYQAE